jgi:hypothetical protein
MSAGPYLSHLALLWLALGLRCPGSSATPPTASQDLTSQAALDEQFQLRNGEAAAVGKGGLTVRFDRVAADERCPVGDACPAEGDAVVLVTLEEAPHDPVSVELHTQSKSVSEAEYLKYLVRLVGLEPRPVGEQPVPLPHYLAVFVVRAKQER